MVSAVSGAAWEVWMMRLTPPTGEATDGTGSTFTTKTVVHYSFISVSHCYQASPICLCSDWPAVTEQTPATHTYRLAVSDKVCYMWLNRDLILLIVVKGPSKELLKHETHFTFDVLLSSTVHLSLPAYCDSTLSSYSCHGDCRDLVDHVDRLHDGGGAHCGGHDGGCCHGVGHRLDGCLRHLTLHSDQYWLVVQW